MATYSIPTKWLAWARACKWNNKGYSFTFIIVLLRSRQFLVLFNINNFFRIIFDKNFASAWLLNLFQCCLFGLWLWDLNCFLIFTFHLISRYFRTFISLVTLRLVNSRLWLSFVKNNLILTVKNITIEKRAQICKSWVFVDSAEVCKQFFRECHVLCMQQVYINWSVAVNKIKSCPKQLNVVVEWSRQVIFILKLLCLSSKSFYDFWSWCIWFAINNIEIAQFLTHLSEQTVF